MLRMKITKNAWICEVERARYRGVRVGGFHKYTGKVTESLDRRWQKMFKKDFDVLYTRQSLSKQVIIIHNGYSNSKAYIYFCFFIIHYKYICFYFVWRGDTELPWHIFPGCSNNYLGFVLCNQPTQLTTKQVNARIPQKVLQELLCSLKTSLPQWL